MPRKVFCYYEYKRVRKYEYIAMSQKIKDEQNNFIKKKKK